MKDVSGSFYPADYSIGWRAVRNPRSSRLSAYADILDIVSCSSRSSGCFGMIGKPCAATAAATVRQQLVRLGLGFTRQCHSDPPFTSDSLQMLVDMVASGVGSLQDMEASLDRLGVTVTPSLVTHVINSSCNNSGSSRRLLRFFSWCRQKSSSSCHEELGDEVFNHAIRAFSGMKDLTAMGIAILDLQKEGRKMDPETFVHVAETFIRSGRPDQAVRLFRNIEEKQQLQWRSSGGEGWSSVTAIVHALCAKGHARKAQGILWHHKDKDKDKTEVHQNHYRSLLLHGWCVHGNAREARRVITEMKSSGNRPSLASYHDLLQCICKRNLKFNPSALVPEATDLMTEMRSSGISPTTVSFNILLSCLGRTRRVKEACRILFSMMRGDGAATPDLVSYYLVIRLLYLTRRFVKGNRLLDQMVEEEEKGRLMPRPNARFYHGLIGVLCGMENVDFALQIFERMKKRCCSQGEEGDKSNNNNICGPTYDLLISKLCRSGKFDLGRRLWDEAVERGVTLQCSCDLLDPSKAPQVFNPTMKPPVDEVSPDIYCKRRELVQKWKNGASAISRTKDKVKGKKGCSKSKL